MSVFSRTALYAILLTGTLAAQTPLNGLNPAVKQIVDAISEDRIAANLKKLDRNHDPDQTAISDAAYENLGYAYDLWEK